MAVQKTEYQVTGKNFTRYIDGLINGAQGVVEMVCLENDVLRTEYTFSIPLPARQ